MIRFYSLLILSCITFRILCDVMGLAFALLPGVRYGLLLVGVGVWTFMPDVAELGI